MKIYPLILLLLLAAPAQAGTDAAEQALAAKLQKQMDALLGPGKAQITVSGRSDDGFQTRSVTRTQVGPGSQRRSSEKHSDGIHVSERSSSQSNTVYNQTETLRSHAPSVLSQKSVAVIYEPPAAGEADEARPPVDPALIEDVVRSAAGIDESRGDHLSVHAAHIDTSKYDALKTEMANQKQGPAWWIFALIGLIGMGLGTSMGLLLRRRQRPQMAPEWQATGYVQTPLPATPALNPGSPLGQAPQGPVIQISAEKP